MTPAAFESPHMRPTPVCRRCAGALAAALATVFVCCIAASPARADERADTLALVSELKKDEPHKALLADILASADLSLDRAARLRALGDEVHARLADGLAREWAESGR